jgi:hypothetical protein
MGKIQAIFDTNINWQATAEALKENNVPHQVSRKGLIKVKLKKHEIIAEISPKGTLILTYDVKEHVKGQAEKYPNLFATCRLLEEVEDYLKTNDGNVPLFHQTKFNYLYSGLKEELAEKDKTAYIMLQTLLGAIYNSKFREYIKQAIEKEAKEREDFDIYDIPKLLTSIAHKQEQPTTSTKEDYTSEHDEEGKT